MPRSGFQRPMDTVSAVTAGAAGRATRIGLSGRRLMAVCCNALQASRMCDFGRNAKSRGCSRLTGRFCPQHSIPLRQPEAPGEVIDPGIKVGRRLAPGLRDHAG